METARARFAQRLIDVRPLNKLRTVLGLNNQSLNKSRMDLFRTSLIITLYRRYPEQPSFLFPITWDAISNVDDTRIISVEIDAIVGSI